MSEYDDLAEQQLKNDMTMGHPADILNDLAFRPNPTSKPTPAVVNPTKRKLDYSVPVETSPGKRTKTAVSGRAPGQIAMSTAQSPPKKLGRPRRRQPQDMANPIPSVKQAKGDPYEYRDSNTEESPSEHVQKEIKAKPKKSAPKKAAPSATRKATSPPMDSSAPEKNPVRAANTNSMENRRIRPNHEATGSKKESDPGTDKPQESREYTASASPSHGKGQGRSKSLEVAQNVRSTRPRHPTTRKSLLRKEPQSRSVEDQEKGPSKRQSKDDSSEADSQQGDVSESSGDESDHDALLENGDVNDTANRAMDLFGQEQNWEVVLKSAKTVHEYKSRPKTETIRILIQATRRIKSIYKQLASMGEAEEDHVAKLDSQLQLEVNRIEGQLEQITEANAGKKSPDVIRDIFTRAVPEMVFLLDFAFRLRTSQRHGLYRYSALQAVVGLQDMLLKLCMKAKTWSVKPNTGDPIKKPVVSVILPYTRDMKKDCFDKQFKELQRYEKIKANFLKTKTKELEHSQREASTFPQQRNDRGTFEVRNSREREAERLEAKKLEDLRRRGVVPVMRKAPIPNDPPLQKKGPHEWSFEQTQELAEKLRESGNLHGNERWYYIIDKSRLLQNMLADHIRDRALLMKPHMMEIGKGAYWWIENIE